MSLTQEQIEYIKRTRKPGAAERLIRVIDEGITGDKILTTRVSFGTMDDLQRTASAEGITVSELVRRGIELALVTYPRD